MGKGLSPNVMKTVISMAVGAAMLLKAARMYGIHSFADVKEFLGMEVKNLASTVKHEFVTT
jgi:hypothetical protein